MSYFHRGPIGLVYLKNPTLTENPAAFKHNGFRLRGVLKNSLNDEQIDRVAPEG